jgi:hypothetical protein
MRISGCFLFLILTATRSLAFPLTFEQRDATHFLARLPGGSAELSLDRLTLGGVTFRFVGSSPSARFEGVGAAAPTTYLRAGFVRALPQYARIRIRGLYPGVDAVFYGSGENLEYDLQLSRGGSIERIRISVEGAHDLAIDERGDLTVRAASSVLRQIRPHVVQEGREISAAYVLLGENRAGIRLGKYDGRAPVTIDPVLSYIKTFGSGVLNTANLVATDAQGDIYVAGECYGVNFPTTAGSFEPNPAPTLSVVSNAGKTISPVRVTQAMSVGKVGATPDGAVVYAATSQGILLSGDGGATWRQTSPLPVPDASNSPQPISINAISIDSLDPATLLVATNRGLYGTDSGGEFWGARNTGLDVSASGYVSVVSAFYHPTNPLIAYAVTTGPSSIYASADAGNTWQRLNPVYPGEAPSAHIFLFSKPCRGD